MVFSGMPDAAIRNKGLRSEDVRSFAEFPWRFETEEHRGTIHTQSSIENERRHSTHTTRIPLFIYPRGRVGKGERGGGVERRRRGNRQQPPLGVGVGVGDATGGLAPRHRRPRSERAPVSLLAVHDGTTGSSTTPRGRCLRFPCAARKLLVRDPRARVRHPLATHDDGKDPRIGRTQPRRRARSNAGRPRL